MRDYKELIEALRSFANSYVQMFGKGESSQLMNDASDAIEDLIAALTASNEVIAKSGNRWISVEERLPEEGERVLILYELRDDEENISIGWLANGGFDCWDDSLWTMRSVTHWMPLPEPPAKEES